MSRTSWQDLYNLGAISAISASSRQNREMTRWLILRTPPSRKRRHKHKTLSIPPIILSNIPCKIFTEISSRLMRYCRDCRDLAEISPSCLLDSKSWRDRGEIFSISPRSRRDLESNKHHGEISARSLQSQRDLINLDEISPISARSCQSQRDLGKDFAWDVA